MLPNPSRRLSSFHSGGAVDSGCRALGGDLSWSMPRRNIRSSIRMRVRAATPRRKSASRPCLPTSRRLEFSADSDFRTAPRAIPLDRRSRPPGARGQEIRLLPVHRLLQTSPARRTAPIKREEINVPVRTPSARSGRSEPARASPIDLRLRSSPRCSRYEIWNDFDLAFLPPATRRPIRLTVNGRPPSPRTEVLLRQVRRIASSLPRPHASTQMLYGDRPRGYTLYGSDRPLLAIAIVRCGCRGGGEV